MRRVLVPALAAAANGVRARAGSSHRRDFPDAERLIGTSRADELYRLGGNDASAPSGAAFRQSIFATTRLG